jgi:hypothetical protein
VHEGTPPSTEVQAYVAAIPGRWPFVVLQISVPELHVSDGPHAKE